MNKSPPLDAPLRKSHKSTRNAAQCTKAKKYAALGDSVGTLYTSDSGLQYGFHDASVTPSGVARRLARSSATRVPGASSLSRASVSVVVVSVVVVSVSVSVSGRSSTDASASIDLDTAVVDASTPSSNSSSIDALGTVSVIRLVIITVRRPLDARRRASTGRVVDVDGLALARVVVDDAARADRVAAIVIVTE
jgi:hypothetical protein